MFQLEGGDLYAFARAQRPGHDNVSGGVREICNIDLRNLRFTAPVSRPAILLGTKIGLLRENGLENAVVHLTKDDVSGGRILVAVRSSSTTGPSIRSKKCKRDLYHGRPITHL